jgi:uncharacterized protein involved in exopolysaccharide biosynthesis
MDGVQNQCLSNTEHRHAVAEDRIDLRDYAKVAYSYRRMILSICAIGMVLAAIVTLRLPKVYSATTLILPPIDVLQDSGLTGGLGIGSGFLRKALGITSGASMYMGILKSRAVADAIIDRFDLVRIYGPKRLRSEVIDILEENTVIKVSGEGIVSVTVEDRDPNRAAAIANAYVEELDLQNKRLAIGQVTSRKVFLENRLKEVEGKLSKIDNILSREAKVQEMLFELLTRECEIAKIEEAKSMPTIQVLDRAVVPETRQPRGLVKKVLLACVASFMFAVFVAFARERFAQSCSEPLSEEIPIDLERQNISDGALAELENKRRIVAAQRRKCSQETESHSRQT